MFWKKCKGSTGAEGVVAKTTRLDEARGCTTRISAPIGWPSSTHFHRRIEEPVDRSSRKVIARRAARSTRNQLLFRGDSTASSVKSSGASGPAKWFAVLRCGGCVASSLPQSVCGPSHASRPIAILLPPQLSDRAAYPRRAHVTTLASDADWPPPCSSRIAGSVVPPFGNA
jgi:hypothetical protein